MPNAPATFDSLMLATDRVPWLTITSPVNVLAPETIHLPVPALYKLSAPVWAGSGEAYNVPRAVLLITPANSLLPVLLPERVNSTSRSVWLIRSVLMTQVWAVLALLFSRIAFRKLQLFGLGSNSMLRLSNVSADVPLIAHRDSLVAVSRTACEDQISSTGGIAQGRELDGAAVAAGVFADATREGAGIAQVENRITRCMNDGTRSGSAGKINSSCGNGAHSTSGNGELYHRPNRSLRYPECRFHRT